MYDFFQLVYRKFRNHLNLYGLFEKQNVKSYVNKFLNRENNFNSYLIFQILIFEIWYKNIIKRNS